MYVKIPKISEIKWNGSFQFLLTGTFRITSEFGSLIFGLTGPTKICCSTFDILVHCHSLLHLCMELGKLIKSGIKESDSSWLDCSYIGKCMSFHFPWAFPLVFYRPVWHNRFYGGNILGLVKRGLWLTV